MKPSHWSPADLDRQWRVVRRIALRADVHLRDLGAARDRLVADTRAAEIVRALVLCGPPNSGLFRSAVASPPTHMEVARDDVA